MAWRKQESHKQETKEVKAALAKAGIVAKVGHGTGTAWGWLEINVGSNPYAHSGEDYNHPRVGCPACEWSEKMNAEVIRIAQEVTGRHGEYNGEILVLMQDGVLQKVA